MVSGHLNLYCIVSMRLYSASCSAYQSKVLSVEETQSEGNSLERTKKDTWLTIESAIVTISLY